MPQSDFADRFEPVRGERFAKPHRAIVLDEYVDVFGGPCVAMVDDRDPTHELEVYAGVLKQCPNGAQGHVDLWQIGVHGAGEAAEAAEYVRCGVHRINLAFPLLAETWVGQGGLRL